MKLEAAIENLRSVRHQGITLLMDGQWQKTSYAKFYLDIKKAEQILTDLGAQSSMRVGICASNCYEWLVYEFALINLKLISVTFPGDEFKSQSLDSLKQKYGLNLLLGDGKFLPIGKRSWSAPLSLDSQAMAQYQVNKDSHSMTLPQDTYALVFSSGTSGKLKCLAISLTGIEDIIQGFESLFHFQTDDAIIAFLSLSVFQQRWMLYSAIYFQFDFVLVDQWHLFKGLAEVRPTIIGAPPLFYESIHNQFEAKRPAKKLMMSAFANLVSLLPAKLSVKLKKKLFYEFHTMMGGRFRIMLIGAAPPKRTTLSFFSMVGLPLFEGYGMTETGYISLNTPRHNKIGTVGRVLSNRKVRITESGEIIAQLDLPLVLDYVFDEEERKRTLLSNNEIYTGDIGYFDKKGNLVINGRAKDIIITAGGVKIHPEIIEKKIESLSSKIKKAVVIRDEKKSTLTAVLSLDAQVDTNAKDKINKEVMRITQSQPREARVTQVITTDTDFTISNGYMSRSLKIDRAKIKTAFMN
jgi:long-chain acyl-CoA synthetase